MPGDHELFNFFQHDRSQGRFQNILQDRFQDRQTPPSNSLKSIAFETYYIKLNPLILFGQQNMLRSCNMVHSHFTLCLRAHDYLKHLSQHPWYGLWMRVKGPHHYKVMALGSCVKWPVVCLANLIRANYQSDWTFCLSWFQIYSTDLVMNSVQNISNCLFTE